MIKKSIVILLGALLLITSGGCGIRKKVGEKLAEKVTEGIIEKAVGGDVDIDLDEGKIKVKGGEGTEWSLGGGKWPKGKAASMIPEFKKGKVETVMETSDECMIGLSEVSLKDFESYVNQLQGAGFTDDVTTYTTEDMVMYGARKGEM